MAVLEDREEYIARLPPGEAERMGRAPFPPLALVNPRLSPLGSEGARFFEGCLSVPGYQACVGACRRGACWASMGGATFVLPPSHSPPAVPLRPSACPEPTELPPLSCWPRCPQALVERYGGVRCDALTPDGAPVRFEARGWQARILQHECDHLAGVLYIDRMLSRSFSTREAVEAK